MVVDLGLSEDLLQSLENAWLRLGEAPAGTELYDEPAVVALLQHESFERIAQQVLRSETVYIFEIGRSDRPAATLDGPNLRWTGAASTSTGTRPSGLKECTQTLRCAGGARRDACPRGQPPRTRRSLAEHAGAGCEGPPAASRSRPSLGVSR